MTPRPEQTEEALIARILALEDTGVSRDVILATLREEGYGQEALDYLALFDLLADERERLDVTLSSVDRYSLGREETRPSAPHHYWEMLMQYMKPRYALTFGAVVLMVLVSVSVFDTETKMATTTKEAPSSDTRSVDEKKQETQVAQNVAPVAQAPVTQTPQTPSEERDIDALILAVGASEGTETFTDDDAELDITSDDALIDNNTMYDESLF
jgi:hypothetical protein